MTDNAEAQPTQRNNQIDAVELMAGIVSAFVSSNSVSPSGLADLIRTVHMGLVDLGKVPASTEGSIDKATAAQIKKSITPDGLISFEDGRTYKTLKRHLTGRGLTPDGYRTKYGLPLDYPMTAPSYSARRSAFARSIGLGRKVRNSDWTAAEPADSAPEVAEAKGGRRKSTDTESAPSKQV